MLEGPEQTARYWDVALPAAQRDDFGFPGLVTAPVLIIALVRAATWIERYGEPDKAVHGLGTGEEAWPVPYWWVDGGMAVEHVLLGAVDAGLGACFFGLFDHEPAVFADLGVPEGWRALGTDRARPSGARPSPASPRGGHGGPSTRSCTAAVGDDQRAIYPAACVGRRR